jgi:hypothetical protein
MLLCDRCRDVVPVMGQPATRDYMSEQDRQDMRDAGRGHLVDG